MIINLPYPKIVEVDDSMGTPEPLIAIKRAPENPTENVANKIRERNDNPNKMNAACIKRSILINNYLTFSIFNKDFIFRKVKSVIFINRILKCEIIINPL